MSNPEEEPLGGQTIVVPGMRDVNAEDTPEKRSKGMGQTSPFYTVLKCTQKN